MESKERIVDKFLIEEFKENWSYIRHIEEHRLKHTHIFLIIIGGVMGIFSFLINHSKGNMDLSKIMNEYRNPVLIFSSFVFLYGVFLLLFLGFQKKGYDKYTGSNIAIYNWFIEKFNEKNQCNFAKKKDPTTKKDWIAKNPFLWWYFLIVLITVFALGFFFKAL